MKTYIFTFFFACFFVAFAQDDDVQYKVTKEYDKNGNLIRYDSIRSQKNHWSSSHFNFSFNEVDMDSLVNGLDMLSEKMDSYIADSIAQKIECVFSDPNFNIWMGDLDEKSFILKFNKMDSLMHHSRLKIHRFKHHYHDSIIEQQLEKELKRIQKKLEKIKAKKQA